MINSEAFDYLNEIYKKGDFIDFKKFKNFLSKNNIYSGVGIDSYALGLLSNFSKNNSSNLKVDNGEDTLEIKHPDNISLLNLRNGIIKGYIDLSFEDREVEENSNMMIRGFSIQGISLFNLIQGLLIHNLRIKNLLEINFGSHYKDKLIKVSRCDIGELYIDGYTIAYNSGGNRLIIDSNIKNLKLENLVGFTNVIVKGNYDIGIFELNNINLLSAKEGRYIISNRKIGRLIINNIDNVSDFFFLSGVEIQELEIINSNLGNMSFFGCSIGKITIYNSSLINTQFNGVVFESYDFGKEYGNIKITDAIQKDNYRQLKYVMDKNGNHTEANKFFAKEMLYYSKILGVEKLNIFSLFNSKFYGTQSEKVGEKISLAISEIISDHGSNLPRVVFVWGMYLFLAYLIAYITNYVQNLLSQSGIFFLKTFQDTSSDLFSILLFLIISLPTSNYFEKKLNQLEKSKAFNRYFLHSTFAIFIGLSFMHVKDFKGIETFIFLLNPLSGFKESIIENFVWTEKIALLIHKVIFATFIYHFIITLRRTTKR